MSATPENLRILVTGGAGFIGHHLVRALERAGRAVLVIDDLSTGRAESLADGIRLERVDVRSPDTARLVHSWRPAIIFHLAAQASVGRSEADPEADLSVNGVGTLRLTRAAEDAGVGRLVFVSSGGAVYGETAGPATEGSLPGPASIYGLHKLLAEGYVRRSPVGHAIARPSNVYGPGQRGGLEGAVVAAFVEAVRAGAPLTIHGDGRQERDFIHVDDVVDALLRLGDEDRAGTWNVSAGASASVTALADLVERLAGRRVPRVTMGRRPGDVTSSRISSERLRQTGWAPRVTLEAGLRDLLGNTR